VVGSSQQDDFKSKIFYISKTGTGKYTRTAGDDIFSEVASLINTPISSHAGVRLVIRYSHEAERFLRSTTLPGLFVEAKTPNKHSGMLLLVLSFTVGAKFSMW